MLTPPLVTMASHVAAASRSTASSAASSSRDDAEVDRLAARRGDQPEQHRLVALADLAGPQRRAVVDQLVAGRQHRHPRPPGDDHRRRGVDAGEHAGHRGVSTVPAANTSVPDADVVADAADRSAGARPLAGSRTRVPPSRRSVSSTITMASAPAGMGAPVMIRIAWPAPTVASLDAPAATSSTTAQLDRGRGDVGGAHRVTVDRRVGERAERPRRRSTAAASTRPERTPSTRDLARPPAARTARARRCGPRRRRSRRHGTGGPARARNATCRRQTGAVTASYVAFSADGHEARWTIVGRRRTARSRRCAGRTRAGPSAAR